MRVVCVDNSGIGFTEGDAERKMSEWLTVGKTYEVISKDCGMYQIKDDTSGCGWFDTERFTCSL